MTKKSIGQFIAALRKANGMTQKQLGEMLNVSDKAISRWERDECAPDLSLIPVIAEIFSVTSDEILRGERIIKEDDLPASKNNGKTEKQIERLLNDTQSKFRVRSMISLGIACLGMFAAMIGNTGFLRAYIGFFAGCIFFIAALICESIFINLAFSSVNSSDFDFNQVNSFKEKVFSDGCFSFALIIIMYASTLPLIYLPTDTYMGVSMPSCLIHGFICACVFAIICIFVIWIVKQVAVKKGVYTLTEAEAAMYHKTNKLKKKFLIITAIVLAVTFLGQAIFNSMIDTSSFSKGTVFTDIEEFKECMETETSAKITNYSSIENLKTIPVEDFFDVNIDTDDTETEYEDTIEDEKGNVICRFIHRNQNVPQYNIEWDGDKPIITTYTTEELWHGGAIINIINAIWVAGYIIEIVAILSAYMIKKKKS